jgi:DNA-binding MarR family transcriptional regulator
MTYNFWMARVEKSMVSTCEHLSERLFGRPIRLPLLLWVSGCAAPDFFATEIAEQMHVSSSNVSQELDRLIDLGMIEPVARKRGDIAKRFVLVNHPGWGIVKAASQVLSELEALDQKQLLG